MRLARTGQFVVQPSQAVHITPFHNGVSDQVLRRFMNQQGYGGMQRPILHSYVSSKVYPDGPQKGQRYFFGFVIFQNVDDATHCVNNEQLRQEAKYVFGIKFRNICSGFPNCLKLKL